MRTAAAVLWETAKFQDLLQRQRPQKPERNETRAFLLVIVRGTVGSGWDLCSALMVPLGTRRFGHHAISA